MSSTLALVITSQSRNDRLAQKKLTKITLHVRYNSE
jgi:hypothetical protein